MGMCVIVRVQIGGHMVVDMYTLIEADFKLPSYKLDDVTQHFLGERKDEMDHTEISQLFCGMDANRNRLAQYCLQDALLLLRLMTKLASLTNYIELARVKGVPLDY